MKMKSQTSNRITAVTSLSLFIILLLFIEPLFSEEESMKICIEKGIEAAFNFEFNEAHRNFKQIYISEKSNPASYFYFAWLLNQMQEYYMTEDDQQIMQYVKYANLLAEKKLKSDKKDIEALFYKAAVNGLIAYREALRGSWWNSSKYGQKMRSNAKKMLQIEPHNTDALYFLGTYDYFADIIPSTHKILRSMLMIPGGSRLRGKKELKEASISGKYTKLEAEKTLLLINVYYERNCTEGEMIGHSLLQKFPDNPVFKLALAMCSYHKHEWEKSAGILEKLPARYNYLKQYGHASIVNEIEYWLARCYLHLNQHKKARELLLALTEAKPKEPRWIYQWSIISLAQSYDLEGDSTNAIDLYNQALQMKNYKNAHDKISIRLKSSDPLPLSSTDY